MLLTWMCIFAAVVKALQSYAARSSCVAGCIEEGISHNYNDAITAITYLNYDANQRYVNPAEGICNGTS